MGDLFHFTILIDWGTERIRWTLDGEIDSLPNVVAFSKASPDPVAVGEEALRMLKDRPELEKAVPPPGILFADPEAMTALFAEIMQRACLLVPWNRRLLKPKVLASVPLGTTKLETRGFCQVLKTQAQSVILCEAPMAAALGAGYGETDAPFGMLDIGAGTMQVAVAAQGGLAHTVFRRDSIEGIHSFVEAFAKERRKMAPRILETLRRDGIRMTGGRTNVPEFVKSLSDLLEFPVHPAQTPEHAVCRGLLELAKDCKTLWKR